MFETVLPVQRVLVQSLVGDLISHMLWGTAIKKKKKERKKERKPSCLFEIHIKKETKQTNQKRQEKRAAPLTTP